MDLIIVYVMKKGGSVIMIRDELEEVKEELYKSINNGTCLV